MYFQTDAGDYEQILYEADELLRGTDNPNDLAQFVIEDTKYCVLRNRAAKKILGMWSEGQNSTTLDHVAIVAQHATEPFRGQANDILHSNM
jgi:hypothetical protein